MKVAEKTMKFLINYRKSLSFATRVCLVERDNIFEKS